MTLTEIQSLREEKPRRKAGKWFEVACLSCSKKFSARKSYVERGQMKFCSPKCSSNFRTKNEVRIVDGIPFYLTYGGYYESRKPIVRLHRYLWEKQFGKIPDGHVIHHKDGNKINNELSNLQCMSNREHTLLHNINDGPHVYKKPKSYCTRIGCSNEMAGRGLCHKHYQQMHRKHKSGKAIGIALATVMEDSAKGEE